MKQILRSILLIGLVAALPSALKAQPVTDGLVAYFPFTGNASDASGNGNDGTVTTATLTADKDGNPNSAYSFAGGTDKIVIGTNGMDPTQGTISMWVSPNQATTYNNSPTYFDTWGPSGSITNERIVIYQWTQNSSSTIPILYGGIDSWNQATSYEVPDWVLGNWYHISMVWRAKNDGADYIKLYVNGIKVVEQLNLTLDISTSSSTANLGRSLNGYSSYSIIDEVMIFNRPLSDEELASVHQGSNNLSNCLNIYCENGKVGIGTSTPSKLLDVAGDINLTGSLYHEGSALLRNINSNLVLGTNTLSDNGLTSISNNTIIGQYAGSQLTMGDNIFMGHGAGRFQNNSTSNLVIGLYAAYGEANETNTNSGNIILGKSAGFKAKTASHNIFIGTEVSFNNENSTKNIIIGYTTAKHSIGGDNNVVIGNKAGENFQNMSNSVAIGTLAGSNNKGANNVFIGAESGKNNEGHRNVFIGKSADVTGVVNDQLVIDNGVEATPLIAGDFSARTLTIDADISVARTLDASGFTINGEPFTTSPWGTNGDHLFFGTSGDNKQISIGLGATEFITVTPDNPYRLLVGGGILSERVRVMMKNNWPDFVFADDYKLNTLDDVENYIKKYKHLPNVPSAQSVAKEGIDVGQMDATLLQKIEELTLYMIDQNKQLKSQNQKIEDLIKSVELLKKENEELKNKSN